MNPLAFLLHLLSFAAPALVVAVIVALAGRLVMPAGRRPCWWVSLATNAVTGLLVLVAGLWWFGRDGKMATYAALVVAVATAQWLVGRAWRP